MASFAGAASFGNPRSIGVTDPFKLRKLRVHGSPAHPCPPPLRASRSIRGGTLGAQLDTRSHSAKRPGGHATGRRTPRVSFRVPGGSTQRGCKTSTREARSSRLKRACLLPFCFALFLMGAGAFRGRGRWLGQVWAGLTSGSSRCSALLTPSRRKPPHSRDGALPYRRDMA